MADSKGMNGEATIAHCTLHIAHCGIADRINPVALKELRQMVRSRVMNIAIIAFLLIEVVMSLLIAASSVNARAISYNSYSHIGQTIFGSNLVLLAVVVLLVVPWMTFARVVREKSPKQVDLQYVTTMTPYNFVNGKLFCSIALTLMFVFATLPVMSLAYLLRGVAISDIITAFIFCIVVAVLVNLIVIVFGAADIPPALKWLVMIGGGFFGGFWSFIALLIAEVFDHHSLSIDAETIPILILAFLAVFMLLWSLGIACFSSKVGNRFKAFKITYIVCEFASLACAASGILGDREDALTVWLVISLIIACLIALLMSGCKAGISRRVRMEVESSKVSKFFLYFVTTGAENGIVLAFLMGVVSAALIPFVVSYTSSHMADFYRVIVFLLYFFGYLMVFRGIWLRLSRKFSISPILVPVAAVALQAVLFFAMMIITDGARDEVFIPLDSIGVFPVKDSWFTDNLGAYLCTASVWFGGGIALVGKEWFVFSEKELSK